MSSDRTKAAWEGLRLLQDPTAAYARLYRAKVVAQTGDENLVDVRPDDHALPDMARIPLRHGVPGLRVQLKLGSYVQVGWEDGEPDKPFAGLWDAEASVEKVSIVADELLLGGRSASEQLVFGTTFKAALDALAAALSAALSSAVTTDSGVAVAACNLLLSALPNVPYLSSKVRTT